MKQFLNSAPEGYEDRRVLSIWDLLDLQNSPYPTQRHSMIAKYRNRVYMETERGI